VDFTRNTDGYIASFITDVADPSLLLIPAGNWNLEFYFSSSSAGGSPSFYAQFYKYNGTTFTLIASDSATPKGITNGTTIDAYFTTLAVPETVLTVNDRLAIRVYVNTSGRTITLHTQNGHLCEVITTFTNGLTALNGLQAQVQNFQVGTSGTDFSISSSGSTHTFNLPNANVTARGVVSTGTQTFAGHKAFSSISFGATGVPVFFEYSGIPFLTVGAGGTFSIGGGPGAAQNNLAVPNGTFNIGLQTASTIASFDANKNVVSLPTATYPSLTELTYVKGVTGAIQTQLNGKQPINANLTSISALTTSGGPFFVKVFNGNYFLDNEGNYTEVAEQSLSGANFSATGGTLPSGTQSHSYRWSRMGNLVTVRINLQFQTAGTCSGIAIPFASMPDIPQTPQHPSIYNAALEMITYGAGNLANGKGIGTFSVGNGASGIRIKTLGAPNTYEFVVGRASSSYTNGWIHVQYYI